MIVELKTRFHGNPDKKNAAKPANEAEETASVNEGQERVLDQLRGHQFGLVRRFSLVPYMALEVDIAALRRLEESADVLSIQEDGLAVNTLAESTRLIGADVGWGYGYTGAGQTVAIIDTGVEKTHSFLSGKVVSEACYSVNACPGGVTSSTASGSGVPCSWTGCDHGTHVAGIAAGRGANFNGVAPDATIIAIKVFSRYTTAAECSPYAAPCVVSRSSDQIAALERVYTLRTSYNISSVNMSLGGGKYTATCDTDSRKAVIDKLKGVGIATVISSGNSGYSDATGAPGCISTAVTVGSVRDGGTNSTPADAISAFSNSASFLDLLAPGEGINSSITGNTFGSKDGTSMAAPHVTGAYAVMKAKSPTSSVDTILSTLKSSGVSITDSRNNITKSRIRLETALNLPRYTAVWRKSTSSEIQVYGWTYASYRAKYDELWPQGWRLYTLQPFVVNGQVRYNAVWRPSTASEIQVYGWTYADFRAKYDELWPQGWRVYLLEPYVINGAVRYTAVWRKSTASEIQVYGWTYADFRAKYDELWPQGWRLLLLKPYVLNGTVYYTAVWRPSTASEIQVYGWTYTDFRAKYDELWPQGWRLYLIQPYVVNGAVRYTAAWRKSTVDEIQVYGWNYSDYRAEYDQLWGQGWRLQMLVTYQP